MGDAEHIFPALGELSTRQTAKTGGGIAHRARVGLESKTGREAVTGENYLLPSKSKRPQGLREHSAHSASPGQTVRRNSFQVPVAGPGADGQKRELGLPV